MSEAPRQAEVRVGSAGEALLPTPGASRPLGAGVAQWIALSVIVGAAALADQGTKAIVVGRLAPGERIDLVGPFAINNVRNTGIAFGLFEGSVGPVVLLTALTVAALVVFYARCARRHPLLPAAVGLLLGGSVANLADRLRLGSVVDFLDPSYWPSFNLADTFIVLGVALLFWALTAPERIR